MKKFLFPMLLVLGLFIVAGCDSSNNIQYEEQLVLQGIMYVGQPIRVRLVHTVPMGQTYTPREIGVSDAYVRVTTGVDTFLLTEQAPDSSGSGYYAVEDTAVQVTAGGTYSIHIEWGEHVLDAQTVGAGTTEIVYQSADTVEYGDQSGYLRLRWQRDSLAAGYVAMIDNLEPDWFEDYRAVSGNNGPDLVPWNLWAIPATDDTLKLPWVTLGYTGRHRLRLLSCDWNLWNYVFTYIPNDPNYNPTSNVRGGFGVFSVGGVDTTYFMLTDTISDGPNGGG